MSRSIHSPWHTYDSWTSITIHYVYVQTWPWIILFHTTFTRDPWHICVMPMNNQYSYKTSVTTTPNHGLSVASLICSMKIYPWTSMSLYSIHDHTFVNHAMKFGVLDTTMNFLYTIYVPANLIIIYGIMEKIQWTFWSL